MKIKYINLFAIVSFFLFFIILILSIYPKTIFFNNYFIKTFGTKSFLLILAFLFLFIPINQSFRYLKIKLSNTFYVLFLLFLLTLQYIFTEIPTAFLWTTLADIPLILRFLDAEFLLNDAYTNASVGSLRIPYAGSIYFFSKLGFNWYSVIYSLKILIFLSLPVLNFLISIFLLRTWYGGKINTNFSQTIKLLSFFFSIGVLVPFQSGPNEVLGWPTFNSLNLISPMTLSCFLGMTYMYLRLAINRRYLTIVPSVLLMASIIVHPSIGICISLISFLFLYNHLNFDRVKYDFSLGFILPVLGLFIVSLESKVVSTDDFVQIYLLERHAHHFLVSQLFNLNVIVYFFILCLIALFSKLLNNSKLYYLNLLIILSFVLCISGQYIFSELFYVRTIIEIGPLRYITFLQFIIQFQVLLLIGQYFINVTNEHERNKNSIKLCQKNSSSQLKKTIFLIITFLICLLLIFFKTYSHPLKYYEYLKINEPIRWIKENTKHSDIFFAPPPNNNNINEDPSVDKMSFFIRIYGKRSIYADFAYPFNDKYIKDFSKSYKFYLNFHKKTLNELACLDNKINYFIAPIGNSAELSKVKPIYQNEGWLIIKMSDILKVADCKLKN